MNQTNNQLLVENALLPPLLKTCEQEADAGDDEFEIEEIDKFQISLDQLQGDFRWVYRLFCVKDGGIVPFIKLNFRTKVAHRIVFEKTGPTRASPYLEEFAVDKFFVLVNKNEYEEYRRITPRNIRIVTGFDKLISLKTKNNAIR